jgi:hypothetical protein
MFIVNKRSVEEPSTARLHVCSFFKENNLYTLVQAVIYYILLSLSSAH